MGRPPGNLRKSGISLWIKAQDNCRYQGIYVQRVSSVLLTEVLRSLRKYWCDFRKEEETLGSTSEMFENTNASWGTSDMFDVVLTSPLKYLKSS